MNAHFDNPHAFWLLLLIPPYLWWARRRVTTVAVRYPSIRNLARLPKSFRQRMRWLMPALRGVALALLVAVLARPTRSIKSEEMPSQGIGIAMLVDRSASMGDPRGKLMYDGRLQLRFDVAADVLKRFIIGDQRDLKGRPNDQIGLFTFATYPRTDYPFGLDHDALVGLIGNMGPEAPFLDAYGRPTSDEKEAAIVTDEYGRQRYRENPLQLTSLRSAIEYAAKKLILLEEDLKRPNEGLRTYQLKNKVIVMLTDGLETVAEGGTIENIIKMLKEAGIKVYYIQILAKERYRERPDGTVEVIPQQAGPFVAVFTGPETAQINKAIEEARQIARQTGGQHYLTMSGDQLKEVYEKIDTLERSEIGGRTVLAREERYGGFLQAALTLLVVEMVLGLTLFRRSP